MTKKKNPKDYLKLGRPSKYTPELGEKICRAIATSTDSLKAICARNDDFPNRECIWGWRLDFPDFANMYDNAKRTQADLLAEEIKEIADDVSNDTLLKQDKQGNEYEVANTEWIARSRLRVDTRKWIACKLLPKVYGDRVDHKHDVTVRQEDALKELE